MALCSYWACGQVFIIIIDHQTTKFNFLPNFPAIYTCTSFSSWWSWVCVAVSWGWSPPPSSPPPLWLWPPHSASVSPHCQHLLPQGQAVPEHGPGPLPEGMCVQVNHAVNDSPKKFIFTSNMVFDDFSSSNLCMKFIISDIFDKIKYFGGVHILLKYTNFHPVQY